jgi:hypothetical protein
MEDVHKCMAVLQAAEGRCVCSVFFGTISSRLTFLSFIDGTLPVAYGM